jgi:hypothetical protein
MKEEIMQGAARTTSMKYIYPKTVSEYLSSHALEYSKINDGEISIGGFGDISASLTWQKRPKKKNSYSARINLVLPTAAGEDPEYLLQPYLGNGGSWVIGGAVKYTRLEFLGGKFTFSLSSDYHFPRDVRRVYDLKKPNWSRFVILRNEAGQGSPAANLLTLKTKVSPGIQIQTLEKFEINKQIHGLSLELMHSLWLSSKEDLQINESIPSGLRVAKLNNNLVVNGSLQLNDSIMKTNTVTAANAACAQIETNDIALESSTTEKTVINSLSMIIKKHGLFKKNIYNILTGLEFDIVSNNAAPNSFSVFVAVNLAI